MNICIYIYIHYIYIHTYTYIYIHKNKDILSKINIMPSIWLEYRIIHDQMLISNLEPCEMTPNPFPSFQEPHVVRSS